MATEQRVRIEDYLNDKLQSQADLDNLDSLLQSVQEQQDLLKQQLNQAQVDQASAEKAAAEHGEVLAAQVRGFRKRQNDIDKRLLALTQSEVSDDAVQKFEEVMRRADKLEIAEGYINLLYKVDKLVNEAYEALTASPRAALGPWAQLQVIVANIRAARPATEDAAPHLDIKIQDLVGGLWKELFEAFDKDIESVMARLGWPRKGVQISESLQQDWVAAVDNLLELQTASLLNAGNNSKVAVLLPLEIMLKPLAAKFRYHFSGDRPTNRLDKPEYFLSHAVDILNDYDGFFASYLQPLLTKHFKGTSLALEPEYIDSTSALITAVLPMVREKLKHVMNEAIEQPHLLSHLMHELMSFDTGLREEWDYGGGSAEPWPGLAGELLDDGWFERWLKSEKDFALNRYREIINSPDSGEIDHDSVDADATKPTKAAMRVNDLLETITDRYRPLISFRQKLRFVIDIQLAIFDQYYERLHEALDAFVTLSNPLTRKMQGYSREDALATQGIKGLERLCRIYGSAEYLVQKMSDWSNDVFFLELWDELQFRSSSQSTADEKLEISVESVSRKSADDGALFDEISNHYEQLRARTEAQIVEKCSSEIREALRPYYRINPWTNLEPESDPSTSAELDPAIQVASDQLRFLRRCLATPSLRRIVRHILHECQTWIWDNIMLRNSFSAFGADQLLRDVTAFWAAFDLICGNGFGRSVMRKMDESIRLVTMPKNSDDGETLASIEQQVFSSNDEARTVLDGLGFEVLAESDARTLLEKRIELRR